jgi:uncharacterized membrane protein
VRIKDAPARRLLVGGLSLAGLVVAVYLSLFQAKVVRTVWDPFALGGSTWILRRSPLVRWLGFPDAAIGAAAYAAELVLDAAVHGRAEGAGRRRLLLGLGALAGAMALGSAVLVVLQAVYGYWCSLCLVSAAVSVAIAASVAPEALAARSRRPSAADARPPAGGGHDGDVAAPVGFRRTSVQDRRTT